MDISNVINDLEFDFDGFNALIHSIIEPRMAELVSQGKFSTEIQFLPLDAQNISQTQTPAITCSIEYLPLETAMDSFQINNFSDITIQFDVYTSGSTAKQDNVYLRNVIIQELIKIRSVGDYRLIGMNVDDNTLANSIINGVKRGVVRISCIVDNKNKLISKRRM